MTTPRDPDGPTPPERSGGVGRWILIVLALIAIAALAFAVGRFSAFGASVLPATPASDSADAGFARDMQVHHAQAVEMAMVEHRQTSDDELRLLSYDIATSQSTQKGEMYGWLVQWGLPQSGALMSWMAGSGHGHGDATSQTEDEKEAAMGMATDAELATLRAQSGTAADCTFLALMTRHHQGALVMIDAVLDLGSDPRVHDVATSMRATQGAEVDAMKDIAARIGCAG